MYCGTVQELEEKLQTFVDGKEETEAFFRGQSNRNKETRAIFTEDEDMAMAIDAWIRKRKYAKLADLWVKGVAIQWNTLYGETKPRLISLPSYPFAKDRYWVPAKGHLEPDKKELVDARKSAPHVFDKTMEFEPVWLNSASDTNGCHPEQSRDSRFGS